MYGLQSIIETGLIRGSTQFELYNPKCYIFFGIYFLKRLKPILQE